MDGDPTGAGDIAHIRKLLEEQLALAQDSNKIIHNMRKWGRVAFAAKVVIWTIVLVVPLLLLPYLAPFIPAFGGSASSTSLTSSSLFGYPSPAEIQQIFHPGK